MSSRFALIAIASVGAAATVVTSLAVAQGTAPPRHGNPVLVELYQSQGCSSCPPAEANLNAIAGRRDVVALSFGVTYWDYLGWKDVFATPQFTDRQRDYARYNRSGYVATPQVWINGQTTLPGQQRRPGHNHRSRQGIRRCRRCARIRRRCLARLFRPAHDQCRDWPRRKRRPHPAPPQYRAPVDQTGPMDRPGHQLPAAPSTIRPAGRCFRPGRPWRTSLVSRPKLTIKILISMM